MNISELYQTDPLKACRLALHRTAKLPENDRMDEINRLLETCGIEAIRGEWQNGY